MKHRHPHRYLKIDNSVYAAIEHRCPAVHGALETFRLMKRSLGIEERILLCSLFKEARRQTNN